MEYPSREGKYGLIYQIAKGLTVAQTRYGSFQVCLKRNGRRNRKSFSGEGAFEMAVKFAELIAAKIGASPFGENGGFSTVSNVAEKWLSSNRGRWTSGTYERYSTIVRDYLNPVIGEYPIAKVNRGRVKDLLGEILKIRSPKTVELVHAVLSGIFTEAIDRGYTDHNPATKLLGKVLPQKKKRNLRKPDPINERDLDKVLKAGWHHLQAPLGLILETLALSGLRLGECLAMHIDHMDTDCCQYKVCETVRNNRFGQPKTGERLIDLPNELVSKLKLHILELKKEALIKGERAGYLFPGITQRMVQNAFITTCRLAKVRRRRVHDLRHTYASLLLMKHYSPAYVQKQLGHHSITMTVDIYGHWIPGEGKKDLDRDLRGPDLGLGPRAQKVYGSHIIKIK
jgi:integrase